MSSPTAAEVEAANRILSGLLSTSSPPFTGSVHEAPSPTVSEAEQILARHFAGSDVPAALLQKRAVAGLDAGGARADLGTAADRSAEDADGILARHFGPAAPYRPTAPAQVVGRPAGVVGVKHPAELLSVSRARRCGSCSVAVGETVILLASPLHHY